MANRKLNYVVVGGVNGAGKSTIYEFDTIKLERLKTDRINADEILLSNGGDWKKFSDVKKSMRQVIKEIDKHFKELKSFHHETTFVGGEKSNKMRLLQAKSLNYDTSLIYVGLESPELAIERVKNRVSEGGHGVGEDIVIDRYFKSLKNLSTLEKYFDNVTLFDNSGLFEEIYVKEDHVVIANRTQNFNWVPKVIKEKKVEQSIEKEILERYTEKGKGYSDIEKEYSSEGENFLNTQGGQYLNEFYDRHKNEIDERILELSISTGISEDDLLGENPKQRSAELAYKMCLGNILEKHESNDIESTSQKRDRENDLQID